MVSSNRTSHDPPLRPVYPHEVVIIVSPNPAHRLPEQWVRLWRRRRAQAIWIAANVVAAVLVGLLLPAGLFVAGGLLAAQTGNAAYLVAGGLLTAAGIPVGRKIWTRARGMLLQVTALLVTASPPLPDSTPPRLTRMETDALRSAITALDDVRKQTKLAAGTGNTEPLAVAAERWRRATQGVANTVSLTMVDDRIDVVGKLLNGGAQSSEAEDVRVMAEIAQLVADDVDAAFSRALARRAMGQAGAMWPYVYENWERESREEHGGRKEPFRQWLESDRRENA